MLRKFFCFLIILKSYSNLYSSGIDEMTKLNEIAEINKKNELMISAELFVDSSLKGIDLLGNNISLLTENIIDLKKLTKESSEEITKLIDYLTKDITERNNQINFINQKIDEIDSKFNNMALKNSKFQDNLELQINLFGEKINQISSKSNEIDSKFIEFNAKSENLKEPIERIYFELNKLNTNLENVIKRKECHCQFSEEIEKNYITKKQICENNFPDKNTMNQYFHQEQSFVNTGKKK